MAAQAEDLTEEESALLLEDSVCTRLAALGDFLYDADSVGNLDLDAMAREDEEVRERTALALTQREESKAELSQILSSGAGSGSSSDSGGAGDADDDDGDDDGGGDDDDSSLTDGSAPPPPLQKPPPPSMHAPRPLSRAGWRRRLG